MKKIITTISILICLVAINLSANPQGTKMQLDSMIAKMAIGSIEVPFMSNVFLYNSNGMVYKSIETPYMPNDFLTENYTIYEYNSDNLLTIETNYNDNNIPNWKEESSYTDKKIIEKISYNMENGEWRIEDKYEYKYANGKLSESIFYSSITGVLSLSSCTEYIYENGKLSEELEYYYGETINDKFLSQKVIYSYDENGYLISKETNSVNFGDTQEEEWYISEKEEYTYDNAGNIVVAKNFMYDEELSELKIYSTENWTYNNDYSFNDLVLPYFYSDLDFNETLLRFKHMPVSGVIEFREEGQIVNMPYQLYYSPFNSTDVKENYASAEIYPNPATETITFNWDNADNMMNLKIYDVNGNIIMTKEVAKGESVQLNRINSGNYMYNLTGGKTVLQGKFIKE